MRKEFEVHLLNGQGKHLAKELALKFSQLLEFCISIGDPAVSGRELAIVATKLEESCFFAKKAMAQKKENQE